MKKFTRATLKSVLKNKKCSIKQQSSFNGMIDCVDTIKDAQFVEIDPATINFENDHSFGVAGLWLVGSGGDMFTRLSDNVVEIYNCCGKSIIQFS